MSRQALPKFVEQFNCLLEEAHQMCGLTRQSGLQSETIDSLLELQIQMVTLKEKYVDQKCEGIANLLLGFQCSCQTIISELQMYILLKQEKPDQAWDELISAQSAALSAVRAHPGFNHLLAKERDLKKIEKVFFPPQVFLSTGMTVNEIKCSICNENYDVCEHIKGHPYMGVFCNVIYGKVSFDEVSIVDSPSDKHCRVTHLHSGKGKRNLMSWMIESDPCEPTSTGK